MFNTTITHKTIHFHNNLRNMYLEKVYFADIFLIEFVQPENLISL